MGDDMVDIVRHTIDDDTKIEVANSGYKGFWRPTNGYAGAIPFDQSLMIPRSEWQARIEERAARGLGLLPLIKQKGLKVLNQGQTNYCWINGCTYALMVRLLRDRNQIIRLSPASGGAQIKNYRNEGGWGDEAMEFIEKRGLAPQELWPANAIDPKYKTPATDKEMLNYRVPKWVRLQDRNHDQVVSCLLRDMPVPAGFNWWGHLICYVDLVWRNGVACPVLANSWGESYGDQGFSVLEGNRMLVDGGVAVLSLLAA